MTEMKGEGAGRLVGHVMDKRGNSNVKRVCEACTSELPGSFLLYYNVAIQPIHSTVAEWRWMENGSESLGARLMQPVRFLRSFVGVQGQWKCRRRPNPATILPVWALLGGRWALQGESFSF